MTMTESQFDFRLSGFGCVCPHQNPVLPSGEGVDGYSEVSEVGRVGAAWRPRSARPPQNLPRIVRPKEDHSDGQAPSHRRRPDAPSLQGRGSHRFGVRLKRDGYDLRHIRELLGLATLSAAKALCDGDPVGLCRIVAKVI